MFPPTETCPILGHARSRRLCQILNIVHELIIRCEEENKIIIIDVGDSHSRPPMGPGRAGVTVCYCQSHIFEAKNSSVVFLSLTFKSKRIKADGPGVNTSRHYWTTHRQCPDAIEASPTLTTIGFRAVTAKTDNRDC